MPDGPHQRGVLLLSFGGPQSLEDVGPFLAAILGPSRVTPHILRSAADRYTRIGGSSPLPGTTLRQAAALQRLLGEDIPVAAGFLHTAPRIPDAVRALAGRGLRTILGMSLSPHSSSHSTPAYYKIFSAAARDAGVDAVTVPPWHSHPAFIAALADQVRAAADAGAPRHVLVSAHSLPMIPGEDTAGYGAQISSTVLALREALADHPVGRLPWTTAYQSQGPMPVPWLGPATGDVLADLSRRGVREVLLLAVSFVSDHLETLYDVDIGFQEKAADLGLTLRRVPALNDSPAFIRALATIVREALHGPS